MATAGAKKSLRKPADMDDLKSEVATFASSWVSPPPRGSPRGAYGASQGAIPVMGLEELKRLVERKKDLAERLMAQYAEDYEARTRRHGDWHLVRMAAKSGTTNDKVTALATLVGDNPVANLKSLDILLGLVNAKVGKRYAFKGFDHLTELFKTRLLPDRKLKCLLQRQIISLPVSSDGFSLLLFWYWEECLKERYEKFVAALEEASKDMLLLKQLLYGLLRSKMEQERKLLYALVNKLGDPLRKAASSAGYYLTCLLSEHPNMKLIVIEEVDAFIFRPHVGLRSKYHASCTKMHECEEVARRGRGFFECGLEKMVLISSGPDNAEGDNAARNSRDHVHGVKKNTEDKKWRSRSVKSKEHLLESCVEMDSRLLCALLTGVNRAFPFVASDEADDIIEVQTPILFRLVHSKNFNIGVQALTLLYQISFKNQILSDRFYRALYSKLLVPAALNSSKHEMFLALLFKAMKSDLNVKRISAFSKRLLQISLQQPPQYACGCLCLLSEVLKAKPHMWSMMLQNESVDEDLEHFTDIQEDTKEITDATFGGSIKSLCSNLRVKEMNFGDNSENCKFKVRSSSGDAIVDMKNEKLKSLIREGMEPCIKTPLSARYDPRHREPSYWYFFVLPTLNLRTLDGSVFLSQDILNAETAGWWELTLLAAHVHPSVAAMAQTLLSGVNIVYNGDPLNDLSLAAFLDKFMEKKPRANQRGEEMWHGGSQIAPARKLDLDSHLIGEDILQLAENEVPPEDIIFHKFYANKSTASKKKKKKTKAVDEDDELVPIGSDDSADEEVEEILGLAPLTSKDMDGEYDYEDLDMVAAEDDDELIGDGSEGEVNSFDDVAPEEEDPDDDSASDGSWDGQVDGDGSTLGDDDLWEDEPLHKPKKNKKSQESPFVSVEDFERDKDKYLDSSSGGRKRKPKSHQPKQQQQQQKKKRRCQPEPRSLSECRVNYSRTAPNYAL
ncbi:unnamed protein product [Spirodela intermedia]|uniref:CCAAT-binding factor domain-containing protein n=1 Tax=Spirodela intermedia TaxID=51605 RepID=A0A7I8JLD6_SPIIN|nr:unnamed protein product [Spirodela intermedia]CAA6670571.1 unnamed protein product [Spirodela intermedia]